MTTKNRDVIGHRVCPTCSERGTVHAFQGTKRGYLYQRCACGCDQRTGAKAQTDIWRETEFLPAMKPAIEPPNLIKLAEPPKAEAEKVAPAEPESDLESDQEADLEGEVLEAGETKSKKKAKLPVLLGLAVVSAAIFVVSGGKANVKI